MIRHQQLLLSTGVSGVHILVLVLAVVLVNLVGVLIPVLMMILMQQSRVLVLVRLSLNLVKDEVGVNTASPLVNAVDVRPRRCLDAELTLGPLTVVVRLQKGETMFSFRIG